MERIIITTFKKLNNKNRLVYCKFTEEYLIEQADKKSQFWSEKYISKELASFIKIKYNGNSNSN